MMSITATPELSEREAPFVRGSGPDELVTLCVGAALAFLVIAANILFIADALFARRAGIGLSPAWLQAQNHAQIFGFIGTLVLGVSFGVVAQRQSTASLLGPARICFALWIAGNALQLPANLYRWHWPRLSPVSAALELTALVFFVAWSIRYRAWRALADQEGRFEPWVFVLMGGGCGLAGALAANVYQSLHLAISGQGTTFVPGFEARFLVLCVWGFMAPMIWAVSARFLPALMELKPTRTRLLIVACVLDAIGIGGAIAGKIHFAAVLLLHAAIFVPSALRVFGRSQRPVTDMAHPGFVRLAYVWLRVAATLGVWASIHDSSHIWAASRHLVTAGFICTMVFALFEWAVLSIACVRLRLNSRAIFASLLLLNIGCPLHAISEILAYQGYVPQGYVLWMSHILPVAAVLELGAVLLFTGNVVWRFVRLPDAKFASA